MAEATQTPMSMYNLYLLSNDNVSKYRKEREDCRESRLTVDDQERDMVDFEAIRKISYAGPPFVCVRYDYDLVSSVDELGGELIDVTFDAAGLGKEEVADHGNVVRHFKCRC